MSAKQSIENKSLAPQVEDKALSAESDAGKPKDGVALIAAHPIPVGRIGNSDEIRPGDQFVASKAYATNLVQQGVARLA